MKKKMISLFVSGLMVLSSWNISVLAETGSEWEDSDETEEISAVYEEENPEALDSSEESDEASDTEEEAISEMIESIEDSEQISEIEELNQEEENSSALMDEEKSDDTVALSLDRAAEGVIYVSAQQTDDQAPKGSAENPYTSLKEAVDFINTQEAMEATIELMSDLTATSCARINGKNITIHGNGHTITRGESFDTISDNARSWYNPAMIEVCNSANSATASLYLENIILNDNGITAGTRYSQASTDGQGNNSDTVQDAIIATYDGVGTIVLGNNTTLTGYAGMSAIRLSGGTLRMENGSKITGGKVFTTKGSGDGPAGAIWIQGGNATIEEGASIEQIQGRALYLDGQGSLAVVNGNISQVIPNSNMWNGDGLAMHIRNHGSVVLSETGRIHDITGSNAGSAVIYATSGSFEAQKGSIISNTSNTRLMNVTYSRVEDVNPHRIYLDGEITDCAYKDVLLYAFVARYEIGPNANLHNTTASSKSIGMFYLQNGGEMTIQGEIHHNNNTIVYMGNQGGAGTIVRVKEGAYLHHNEGSYVIYANNSGYVIMDGGEISDNRTGIYVRSKDDWPGSHLDMTDGKIINNKSYGIQYITSSKDGSSYVNITGGEISGNGSYQLYIGANLFKPGTDAKDAISRIYIKKGIVKEGNNKPDNVSTFFGVLSSIEQQGDFYFGNAKSEASTQIDELVKSFKASDEDLNDYAAKGSALWFKADADHLKFSAKRSSSVNVNLPLYVAYIPLKENGTPKEDAQVVIQKVDNDAQVEIDLKNLEPNQSYAMRWMQPTEKFGSLGIVGDPEIHEELGVHHYTVDYDVTYFLSRDILPLLSAGYEFQVDVQLDDRLTFDSTTNVSLPEKSVFEIVSADYDANTHKLAITLRLKEGFKTSSKAHLSFKAYADFDEVVETTFVSDATLSSSLVLSGDVQSTDFTLKTIRPATTHLIPLSLYKIDYRGGSVLVKEGTELLIDPIDGVMGAEYPKNIIEDLILSDPTKDGYVFDGWEIVREETSVSFAARYRQIFTVTFVDYDDQVLEIVEVEAGDDAPAPQAPSRDHYRFLEWDTIFTNVQSDLTVKALYRPLFTVTFVDADDTVLNQQEVEEGEAAVAPEDPSRAGYHFIGWDLSFDSVQSDMTIRARYERIETPAVTPLPETPRTPDEPASPSRTPVVPEVEIPEQDTPLVPPTPEPTPEPAPEPEPVEIPDENIPLASPDGNWALVNLLAAIISVLFAVFAWVKKKDEEQDQEPDQEKRKTILKGLGTGSAVIAVIIFALTEKMTLPMVMVDKWTVLMIVFAGINIVLFGIGHSEKNEDQTSQEA